jgi:LacI family transcriptional regulator, galactose operon repressor
MRDVAALAGVSLKTVSRVVNGEHGVRPGLEQRVRLAIEHLGYRHHLPASNLRRGGGRTESIGLLLEDVGNPFSSRLHRAVEQVARARGVMTLAVSCDEDPQRERDALAEFMARRVDGIIVMPAMGDHSHLRVEHDTGIPIVAVDRNPGFPGLDSVMVDNQAGARRGVKHLLAHGHVRVGFVGDQVGITTADQRYAGYQSALRAAGVALDRALVARTVSGISAGADAVIGLLDGGAPPTALFTAQNLLTIGAVEALRDLGRQHAVALVGFDDFLLADLLDPAVTVVAQDPSEIGARAARRLFARIDGDTSPPRRDVVRTRLIVRGSGELRPPRHIPNEGLGTAVVRQ